MIQTQVDSASLIGQNETSTKEFFTLISIENMKIYEGNFPSYCKIPWKNIE